MMHSRSQVEEGGMTHEEFLQHADECEWLAGMATLPSNRHALLSAAEMWRKMAADIEAREGGRVGRSREVNPTAASGMHAWESKARRSSPNFRVGTSHVP